MFKFRKHVCPPKELIWNVNIDFCSHEDLIPIDKRKNYALVLKRPLAMAELEQISKVLKASGYKVKLVVNSKEAEFKERA